MQNNEISVALNQLIREHTKLHLLEAIKHDINICQLEGLDYKQYLKELKEMIDGFLRS